MTHSEGHPKMNRRTFLAGAAGAAAAGLAGAALAQGSKTGIDAATWTPQHIAGIAGTAEYDTAAECAKVVPLNHSGRLSYWYFGPTQASPKIEHDMDKAFWEAFAAMYPNITVVKQDLNYNEMLDKLRTATLGKAAPMVARVPILWAPEVASKIEFVCSDMWQPYLKVIREKCAQALHVLDSLPHRRQDERRRR